MRLATLLVARRVGSPPPDLSIFNAMLPRGTTHDTPQLIEMPAMDTSSSEIRRHLSAGQSIDGLVPPAVAEYIAAHWLYR